MIVQFRQSISPPSLTIYNLLINITREIIFPGTHFEICFPDSVSRDTFIFLNFKGIIVGINCHCLSEIFLIHMTVKVMFFEFHWSASCKQWEHYTLTFLYSTNTYCIPTVYQAGTVLSADDTRLNNMVKVPPALMKHTD